MKNNSSVTFFRTEHLAVDTSLSYGFRKVDVDWEVFYMFVLL